MSKLPPPESPDAPKFWMAEQSGRLVPAIERFLKSRRLSDNDIDLIRRYFKQWIDSPAWDQNPHADAEARAVLHSLRLRTADLRTMSDLREWWKDSIDAGVDPL